MFKFNVARIVSMFVRAPRPGFRAVAEILDRNPGIVCPWCAVAEIHELHCELIEGAA